MKLPILLSFLIVLTACSKTEFGESDQAFFAKNVPVPVKVEEPKPVIPDAEVIKKVDRYQQNVQKKLDIIWVVDNSGSMSNEQASLAQHFNLFIQDFVDTNVDFKMAITTTDPTNSKRGLMVAGSDTKLTSDAARANPAQFINDFNTLSNVGINGSGSEQGLNAIEHFQIRYPNFLRADAHLVVIIISDEEDSSPKAVSEYVALLHGLKADPDLVKVYSIVDIDKTNTSAAPTIGGDRYIAASTATNGVVGNIVGDFAPILLSMGESIMDMVQSFKLKAPPVVSSIKVYVNGVEVNNYSYKANIRSVVFSVNDVPPAGAEIEIKYQVLN